jgi:AcrR family transcriptional regulator
MSPTKTPLTRREKRRAKRIEEMLDAAMEIALQEGLEKLTIARLAKRIDAAVGALYRYFESKDALVAGMQRRAIGLLRGDLETAFARATDQLCGLSPCQAALAGAVLIAPIYLADAREEPRRHRLIDAWVSDPTSHLADDEARDVNASLALILELVTGRLQFAVDAGALRAGDNLARAHVLWALVHGLDHFRKRDRIQPTNVQTPKLLDQALRALLVGWGAEARAADVAVCALTAVR